MRIETYKGYNIVCGHIYPVEELKIGQRWIGSSGNIVTIINIDGRWVDYSWETGKHCKDSFAFQCRYSLIIENQLTTPIT